MTVQQCGRVVAPTGAKQVGAIASAERGQTVTLCCAVNAAGQALPPMFIFPRVYFKDNFIRDGPPRCIGTAHPSGWMTGDGFLRFMKHFVHQVSYGLGLNKNQFCVPHYLHKYSWRSSSEYYVFTLVNTMVSMCCLFIAAVWHTCTNLCYAMACIMLQFVRLLVLLLLG